MAINSGAQLGYGNGDSLQVLFDQDTDTPLVHTKSNLDSVLEFSANLGADYTGQWRDRRTLHITVTDSTGHGKLHDLAVGRLQVQVQAAVDRHEEYEANRHFGEKLVSGVTHLRFGEVGTFTFKLMATPPASGNRSSTASGTVVKLAEGPTLEVRAYFSVTGVVALSGQHAFTLPHSLLPNQYDVGKGLPSSRGTGSWSFGFNYYLAEGSTGKFRSFFYKGDGHKHRTPSAWLMPQDNRLTLRVSTEVSFDVGLESKNPLPLQRWCHLVFTFQNHTDEAGSSRSKGGALPQSRYTFSLYVDGRQDVQMQVHNRVLPNDSPLRIGRDPTFEGARGMVAGLKVWRRVLNSDEVRIEFETDNARFYQA
eukprot:g630.t1